MKYKLKIGNDVALVLVLRALFSSTRGVLHQTWEFRSLNSSIDFLRRGVDDMTDTRVFPELGEFHPPGLAFQVSGVRLVERSALVWEFVDTELVRIDNSVPSGFDLKFWIDSGVLDVETDDAETYDILRHKFG